MSKRLLAVLILLVTAILTTIGGDKISDSDDSDTVTMALMTDGDSTVSPKQVGANILSPIILDQDKGGAPSKSPVSTVISTPSYKEDKKINVTTSPTVTVSSSVSPKVASSPTSSPVQSPTPTPPRTPTPSPSPTPTPVSSPSTTPTPTAEPSLSPTPIQESVVLSVVINEVAWAGTEASQYGEWIELYNPGQSSIDLSGWNLYEGDIKITELTGAIQSGAYYLVERTTPSSPDPIIDVIGDLYTSFGGSGLRNNPGEYLQVRDSTGMVIDSVDCSLGAWFAGDKDTKSTMERIDSLVSGNNSANWASNTSSTMNGHDALGNPVVGTPRYRNSVSP